MTGAWAAERNGRPKLAGVLLAMATAIKLFPGFLFLYYALRRRWDVVGWGFVALGACTGATMAVLGVGCYRDYVGNVVPEVHWFRVGWNNASLTGFWSRLFDPAPERLRDRSRSAPIVYSPALARALAWITSAAVVAVLAWAVRRARTTEQRDIAFGLAVTAMLLVSPITWDHYFVLLAQPLALTWLRLPRSLVARASFLAIVAALWTLPALVYTITDVGGHVAAPWQSATIVSYQTHALLGLFALGVVELRSS